MWVISEIEGKLYPIKIEVSALPQNWLLWDNGQLFCYWPKTNAGSKIRSCTEPKSDWNIYKCRLLMKGATFESYEEAIEAEQIAEGFSSLSAFRESAVPKRNDCESGTDSSVERGKKSPSSLFDVSSDSSVLFSDDEELVGNDSFEYNERMKLGGDYLAENGNSMYVQLEETKTFPESTTVTKSPQYSDYSATFANGTGILTSTILGSEINDGNFDMATQMNSQIAKMGGMISSFVKDVTHEMEVLTQIVQDQSTLRTVNGAHMSSEAMKSFEQIEKIVPTSNIEILDIKIFNADCDETIENVSTTHLPFDFDVGDTTSVISLNFDGEGNLDTLNRRNIDYLDVVSACNTEKNVENTDELIDPKANEMFAASAPNELNTDKDVTFTINQNVNQLRDSNITTNATKIRLLINDPNHYKQIEKRFLDEPIPMDGTDTKLEKALIAQLCPFIDETEAEYMDRTIGMVFTETFFLERVSWKTETNRINLSANSHVMSCWRKSFESKYGPDVDYKMIKRHFRRVKGTKRAAINAKKKKLEMLKNKMKK